MYTHYGCFLKLKQCITDLFVSSLTKQMQCLRVQVHKILKHFSCQNTDNFYPGQILTKEIILLHIFRHQEGLEATPKLYTRTVNIPKSLSVKYPALINYVLHNIQFRISILF